MVTSSTDDNLSGTSSTRAGVELVPQCRLESFELVTTNPVSGGTNPNMIGTRVRYFLDSSMFDFGIKAQGSKFAYAEFCPVSSLNLAEQCVGSLGFLGLFGSLIYGRPFSKFGTFGFVPPII